jgi:hypothetical protein
MSQLTGTVNRIVNGTHSLVVFTASSTRFGEIRVVRYIFGRSLFTVHPSSPVYGTPLLWFRFRVRVRVRVRVIKGIFSKVRSFPKINHANIF